MRPLTLLRYACIAAGVGLFAVACGSESGDSQFPPPPDSDSGTTGTDIDGSTGGNDDASFGGGDDGGDPNPCKPKTCTELGVECGPAGDGCGNVIQCGSTCPDGQTCGGGGVPSKCGAPPCKPQTCTELGANCGAIGDGCGGLIADCGTCATGEICGGGGFPSKCGKGVAGGDGGTCTPTKTACAPGDCGPIADGCGNVINCPTTCATGQTCGGGGTPSLCGAPPCVKNTCGGQNCGFIADGCGGSLSCWPAGATSCPAGQTCGGGGVANTCGSNPNCTGLCQQQQSCPGGGTTSIEGYVTSPNGKLPVPNAVVYVPNGAVAAFQPNVQCESCATASGNPLVSTTTDANGHFYLPNMPVSDPNKATNIPVVVQLGRWRKQFTIATTACQNNLVPAYGAAPANKTAALPSTKSEGDIPLTAISTGQVDGLECVFRKMGVADTEFTDGSGSGRIRLYSDNGASIKWNSPAASTLYTPCSGNNCTNEIDKYDAVIFGCVGGEQGKDNASVQNIVNYANKGGRIFATHYSYVWLQSASSGCGPWPWQPACYKNPWLSMVNKWGSETSWDQTGAPGSLSAMLDTSFPKGQLFASWLQAPSGTVSTTYPPPYSPLNALYATNPPTIALTEPRADVTPSNPNKSTSGIVSPAQRWIYTTDDNGKKCTTNTDCKSGVCDAGTKKCIGTQVFHSSDPGAIDAPMHFTFNTDTSKPAAQQCGRVLYSDFHVSIGNTNGKTFPAECDNSELTSQEKVLAYMLFDLASCVSTTTNPPTCKPKTCAEQGLGCGLAGDGCGNQIKCDDCPTGQTCGGGGIPSQCGAPACTPKACGTGQCGKMGDGCGGQVDCGACATGTCGGGGPNLCGGGTCTPSVCPTPGTGSVCGPVANGCGQVNNCPCAAGDTCINGKCGKPSCSPLTCAKLGANCGQAADGCGGILNCGTCNAPQTCGGGGVANLCGGGVN